MAPKTAEHALPEKIQAVMARSMPPQPERFSDDTVFTTAATKKIPHERILEHVRASDSGSESPCPKRKTGAAWALTIGSILMANFLFALDNTVVATMQPAIVNQFGSLDKIAWLPVAFFLSSWGTNLLWGGFYARFSAKWTFCTSFVLFSIGSALCGAAPSMDALILGRAICGAGGAGMYFGSMTFLTALPAKEEVPLYVSIVGITFGAGTVLGPIIGGVFADSNATWRWGFYINLIIGGICAPAYIFLLPSLNPSPDKSVKERLVTIDYLGNILICGLVICFVVAVAFGGNIYSWSSGPVVALFALSFVLTVAFFCQQTFAIGTTKDRRIFPIHFLSQSALLVLFVELACAATCVYIPSYFLPLYFQFVRGSSAIEAGVSMLPFIASQVVSTVGGGWIVSKTGYYTPWYMIAGVFTVAGSALLYVVDQHTSSAKIYGYEILAGIGSGASTQLSFAVAAAMVPAHDVPRTTNWQTLAQHGGPTISLSIANAIFLNKALGGIAYQLPKHSKTDISRIIADPHSRLLHDLPRNIQNEVVGTVVRSMSNAYILSVVAGALMLLLSFRFKLKAKLYGTKIITNM